MTTMTMEATVELECRSAQLLDVNFPKRIIDLVVMPYEETATVQHRGNMIEEVVSGSAWPACNGIQYVASSV